MDSNALEHLLIKSHYNEVETRSKFLVEGFRHDFNIEYEGPVQCQSSSNHNYTFRCAFSSCTRQWIANFVVVQEINTLIQFRCVWL